LAVRSIPNNNTGMVALPFDETDDNINALAPAFYLIASIPDYVLYNGTPAVKEWGEKRQQLCARSRHNVKVDGSSIISKMNNV
jgi:hypothetical protein